MSYISIILLFYVFIIYWYLCAAHCTYSINEWMNYKYELTTMSANKTNKLELCITACLLLKDVVSWTGSIRYSWTHSPPLIWAMLTKEAVCHLHLHYTACYQYICSVYHNQPFGLYPAFFQGRIFHPWKDVPPCNALLSPNPYLPLRKS